MRRPEHPEPRCRPLSGVPQSQLAPRLDQVRVTALLLLLALAACAQPRNRERGPSFEAPTSISSSATFGASALPADQEVAYLAGCYTQPALLRRAWLELQLGRCDQSLDSSARVLYADPPPSAHVESFARYLRAEAFRRQGHPERGAHDRERARALALDPGLQRRLRAAPTETAQPRSSTPWGSLAVEPRASWRPRREDRRNLDPMQRPRRVTIHHSAMYFRSEAPQAAASQIARIQREHMGNRRYGDIGYHFLIDPSGRVWEGRELRWQGAHARGSNNVANIGICLLGNFVRDRGGQGPTPTQVASMERLVLNLMRHYRMQGDALYCHSDFTSTACPGARMRPIVRQFARQLHARGALAVAEDEAEDEEE